MAAPHNPPLTDRRMSGVTRHAERSSSQRQPTLRWPDFGRTTLNNGGRRCEPMGAMRAGQLPNAQVACARGTVYGTDDLRCSVFRCQEGCPLVVAAAAG